MKSTEIKNLSVKDLTEKIHELESIQQKLILNHQVSPIENPLQIRSNRKDIARLKTELRKKELQA